MDYFINCGIWNSVFAVPNDVVDNYIKLASGASLKVLLYALRNNGQVLGVSELSKELSLSEENIEEAFCFWENVNILSRAQLNKEKANSPISDVKQTTEDKAPENIIVANQKSFSQRSSSGFSITPSEIANKIDSSEAVKALFAMAEVSFGNVLTYTEQRSLIWIHEYLGLSADVILMLLEYCISIDKKNMRYIETIAISWNENEINTLEAAQNEIKRLQDCLTETQP
jgi:DnaD/phage-associated family protein